MTLFMKPPLIAVCGWPESGKDAFVDFLLDHLGSTAIRIDDGLPLRRAAVALFGVSLDDCLSQEGKKKLIDTCAGPVTLRKILGDIGVDMELRYGPDYTPSQAIRLAEEAKLQNQFLDTFVFSSVRKTQPWYYRARGGIVIEVYRPGQAPSPHEFDKWDRQSVHLRVTNDGTLENLSNVAANIALWLRTGVSYSEDSTASLSAKEFKTNVLA